jgi:sec-independent protein translocase protein TatC
LFAIDWQRDHQRFHYQLQISWPNISHRSDLGELKPILTLQSYLSVSLWFLLGFALVFQTPLIIFMLILSGLITPQQFALYRRHTIVAILIISAVITPTGDPLNLMIMAIPMYILFEIGLLIARIYLRSHPTNTLDQATATDEETSGHG